MVKDNIIMPEFLSNSLFWSIVASITQIIAAVFAAYTVWQAREMIALSKLQIRQSVEPDWDISPHIMSPEHDHVKMEHRVELPFVNTGDGPARNITVDFVPYSKNKPITIQRNGIPPYSEPIPPGRIHLLKLDWACDQPIDGILTLSSKTRLGHRVEHHFHIRTYLDPQNARNGWCDIAIIHEKK